jgi:serine/threonine protein phosphatase PrpC
MLKDNHSPLPWRRVFPNETTLDTEDKVVDDRRNTVFFTHINDDAEFIILCCNNFTELFNAAEEILLKSYNTTSRKRLRDIVNKIKLYKE